MKRIFCLLFFFLLLACSDRAADMYDTAQLEERQRNIDHARQLYSEILEEYPDSPYAEKARERLQELPKQ